MGIDKHECAFHNKNIIRCIGALEKVYKEIGRNGLAEVLTIAKMSGKPSLTQVEIKGLGIFVRSYSQKYD